MAHSQGRTRVAKWLEEHGADPLDSKVREELDYQAKILEAFNAPDTPAPPGMSPEQWQNESFRRRAERAAAAMAEQGRVTDAEEFRRRIEPLWEAMQQNPRTEGMSLAEFVRNVMQAAMNQPITENGKE